MMRRCTAEIRGRYGQGAKRFTEQGCLKTMWVGFIGILTVQVRFGEPT